MDTLAGNRVYTRSVVVINKVDLANEEDLKRAEAMVPEVGRHGVSAKILRRDRVDEGLHHDNLDHVDLPQTTRPGQT